MTYREREGQRAVASVEISQPAASLRDAEQLACLSLGPVATVH
jgi:hypothetical protein